MSRLKKAEFLNLSEKQQDELIDTNIDYAKKLFKVILKFSLYTLGILILFFVIFPLVFYGLYLLLGRFV